MTSPETEASAIFVRHLDRLHQDVMDRMRLQINQIDGTFDATILNEVMKRFLHHNVTGAVGELRNKLSPDEIADSSIFSILTKFSIIILDRYPRNGTKLQQLCIM